MIVNADQECERDRLNEHEIGSEPGWAEDFRPGWFGCHELLGLASTVADDLNRMLLSHPACQLDPEWYALANRAAVAIVELYHRIGSAHLGEPMGSAVDRLAN